MKRQTGTERSRTTKRSACGDGNFRGGSDSLAKARDAFRGSRALLPAAKYPFLRQAERSRLPLLPVAAPCRKAGPSGPYRPSSHLSRFEIDARIDPGVGEVGNQVHHEADEREDIEVGEHDRIVALDERIVGEIAEPVEREHLFDQKGAGEERANE